MKRASILALLIYVVVGMLTPDYALSFNSYPKGAAHDATSAPKKMFIKG